MDFQNLTNPNYTASAAPETGGLQVFHNLVHSYLDLVQRNSFPPDFLGKIFNGTFQSDQIREVLVYEVGYLVALAIGVVFIILMTLVGLFFACCRCCGNCGGKMYQKQTKRMNCKRIFLYWFTFCVTLVILAGDICCFYSNSKMNSAVSSSFSAVNNTLNNLKTYINTVPKDVDLIINTSNVPISVANNSITDIGQVLGGMIKTDIENGANSTLNSVQNMINDLTVTASLLTAINNSFYTLQDQQTQLSNNLTALRTQISNTLTTCGSSCTPAPPVADLTIDADFKTATIPVDKPLNSINDFLNSGIGDTLQQARQTINDIPQTVQNQTKSSVQSVQQSLTDIQKTIRDARSKIPIVDSLNTVNSYFDNATSYVDTYKPDAVKYSYYVWVVGICLSCIILLVVVCNLFGLLFGPCGHKANVDPTDRNCASNSGGDFFMAGAGFSFLFAWLLMIVTAVLFAVGGNVYTSFCKPWGNQQLYQFVDANLNLSKQLGLNISNLTITGLYRNCENNAGLWNTLNLNSMINLDQYLNISTYTGQVNSTLDNTNITVNNITFMDSSQQGKVDNVINSGIGNLNFTDLNQQLAKGITKTNLTSFANQLDAFASAPTATDPSKTELMTEAQSLRNIQSSINNNMLPEVAKIKANIATLQSSSAGLPAALNNTLQSIGTAQAFITSNVPRIVKNETIKYLNTILGYFESYISWTKTMLTSNLARCGPVAGALDSAQVIACQYIVGTINIFWFSLGWCTIFFLPSIIVSVKLAKYYRRMNTSDIYESPNDHLEMTTTSQQFLIPRATAKA